MGAAHQSRQVRSDASFSSISEEIRPSYSTNPCRLSPCKSHFPLSLSAVAVIAEAQQPNKVPRVGFLAGVSPSTIAAHTQAFREGLRELEYVEGKTL